MRWDLHHLDSCHRVDGVGGDPWITRPELEQAGLRGTGILGSRYDCLFVVHQSHYTVLPLILPASQRAVDTVWRVRHKLESGVFLGLDVFG